MRSGSLSLHKLHIGAELAGILRLELTCLELHYDVAQLFEMEEQQVDEELIAVHVERDLPADEAESAAQLSEGLYGAFHQRLLEFPLRVARLDAKEVEDVRILRDLLRELGRTRVQDAIEVRRRPAEPQVSGGLDGVLERGTGPSVRQGLAGVPVPQFGTEELVQEHGDVALRQLRNRLLRNLGRSWPGPGKRGLHHAKGHYSDWENFVNADGSSMPALVQAALMHYQFETIHPFLDGNGRIGRLLINLLLMERGRLSLPLLYLSNYFESHRDEYYDRLQAVRERAEIAEWLTFFLGAVRAQADDAVKRSRALVRIREEYHAQAIQERSNLPRLVDLIARNPFVTVKSIEQQLELTNQGARNLIKNAEGRGWLTSLGTRGRGGRELWFSAAIFEIVEAPMSY